MDKIFVHFADLFVRGMGVALPMTVLVSVLLLFARLFGKGYRAKTNYILWTIVILRLALLVSILPPLFTIPIPETNLVEETVAGQAPFAAEVNLTETSMHVVPDAGKPHPANPVEATPAHREPGTMEKTMQELPPTEAVPKRMELPTLLAAGGMIWVAGAILYFAVQMGLYLTYMHGFQKKLVPCGEADADLYVRLCQRMNITHAPELYKSPDVPSPMLCGYRRPMLVIPDIPLRQNSLVGIFAHELIHHRRGDLWWKLAGLAAKAIHWWNPLVHLASHMQLRYVELSCDEAVLADFGEDARRSYGQVMLEILRKCRGKRSALTTQFNPKKQAVRERFESIMDLSVKERGIWLVAVTLLLSLATGSLIACQVDSEEDSPPVETESETVPGTSTDPWQDNPDVLEFGGFRYYLTEAYRGKVMITKDVEFAEGNPLEEIGEVYHVVDGQQRGLLFAVLCDKEPNPMLELTGGLRYFAKDGAYYYYFYRPTDVRWNMEDPVENEEYEAMREDLFNNRIAENLILANDLEPYDVADDPDAMTLKILKDKQADGSELRLVGAFGNTTSEALLVTFGEDDENFYIKPIEGPISRFYTFYRFTPDGALVPDSKVTYNYVKHTDRLDYWGESPTYTPWLMENYGQPLETLPTVISFEGVHASQYLGGMVEYSIELHNGKDGRLVMCQGGEVKCDYTLALDGYDSTTGVFTASVTDAITGEMGTMTGQLRAYFETFALLVESGTMTAGLEKDLLPLCTWMGDLAF